MFGITKKSKNRQIFHYIADEFRLLKFMTQYQSCMDHTLLFNGINSSTVYAVQETVTLKRLRKEEELEFRKEEEMNKFELKWPSAWNGEL